MDINSIIAISDIHAGCRLGLYPVGLPLMLDEGTGYIPSVVQEKMWGYWNDFWNVWVPMVTRKEKYAVVIVGDSIDGKHHQAVTQISQNLSDQKIIAKAILEPIAQKAKGGLYMIRGTEAHVGPSGKEEEDLARELDAIPNELGQHSRYDLWKRIGEKALVHFLHHIGFTSSNAYESTALMKELSEEYVESARWGDTPPNVVIRAHRHRHIKITIPSRHGDIIGEVLPGWQGKTPFAWRIAGARLSMPQFGGVLIKAGDEDLVYTRDKVYTIGRSATE